ncbi:MAG: hypothetical protein KY462_11440 [Actinobacteria bacterium]|nr:hypothetical protein [Actinomycetota bacterium]
MTTKHLLRSYLDEQISVEELLAELTEQTWDDPTRDRLAIRAVHLIDEASTADLSEEHLREELSDLLEEQERAAELLTHVRSESAHGNVVLRGVTIKSGARSSGVRIAPGSRRVEVS